VNVRLERNLCHILRRKTIGIRTGGISSIKNLLLDLKIRNKTIINLKSRVKSIMFSNNQELLGELSYQSMVVRSESLKGSISSLHTVPSSSKDM